MARKLAIDHQAVAYAVINQVLAEDRIAPAVGSTSRIAVTEHLLDAADVEYLPRARRLTLSFDLSGEPSGESPDPDEPVPYVPAEPTYGTGKYHVDAPPED